MSKSTPTSKDLAQGLRGFALHEPISLLESTQCALKSYILTMIHNITDADDILQETNQFILRKIGDFEKGTNFKAWAIKIAHFRVLTFIRDRQRRGDVYLSEDVLDSLASEGEQHLADTDERMGYLTSCIQKLSEKELSLIKRHYIDGESLTAIAHKIDRPPNTVQKAMSRIRSTLRACIEKSHFTK